MYEEHQSANSPASRTALIHFQHDTCGRDVNGTHTSCICHKANCSHIRCVQLRRAQDAARDAHRVAYEALFDLSYGDIVS